MVHSCIETKPLTVGSPSRLSTTSALDYTTKNPLSFWDASSQVPRNLEKSTLTLFPLSTILRLYNMKASKYLMHLHQKYGDPFPSSSTHQRTALDLLPCQVLLGTLENMGAESTVEWKVGIEMVTRIISWWCPNQKSTQYKDAIMVTLLSVIYMLSDRTPVQDTNTIYGTCLYLKTTKHTRHIDSKQVFARLCFSLGWLHLAFWGSLQWT